MPDFGVLLPTRHLFYRRLGVRPLHRRVLLQLYRPGELSDARRRYAQDLGPEQADRPELCRHRSSVAPGKTPWSGTYIYQINKSIGGADFEIEVIVKDLNHLTQLIEEIKHTFRNIVKDVEYFGFSTFYLLKFIPD